MSREPQRPYTSGAIGETDIGRNGFSFINQIAQSAQNVDQLEWIVAHNVSHELMLAFGVPEVHDQTGNYIDSTKANLAMMLSPTATFSQGAVTDLLSRNFLDAVPLNGVQPQLVGPQAVPSPRPSRSGDSSPSADGLSARASRRRRTV